MRGDQPVQSEPDLHTEPGQAPATERQRPSTASPGSEQIQRGAEHLFTEEALGDRLRCLRGHVDAVGAGLDVGGDPGVVEVLDEVDDVDVARPVDGEVLHHLVQDGVTRRLLLGRAA